ncbi:Plant invertase/pectin methylesterase inhibitor superfamily protein [Raphanus sativus]|uniref:21 kDa protein n=1 Tax=Raphanus sativus TaxID=3726 RepID=A0A6J0JSF9_RAPSA|nr:21 kDa protein [Raphanus sativus]KAJ4889680.1 Plant invertase/pectin methylesterase inhibitor superfamily protein [Raphanus sativus]
MEKPLLHPSLIFFLATLLPLVLTVHSQPSPLPSDDSDFIRTSCNATLYPDLCVSSLSNFSSSVNNDSALLARAAISVTLTKALELGSYLSNVTALLKSQEDNGGHPTAAAVFHDCFENLKDAVGEMKGSMKQMRDLVSTGSLESFRFQMSNVQTWLSAALTDEETCTDGFKDVQDEPRKDEVCARVDDVKKLTSNALALVNRCVDKAIH